MTNNPINTSRTNPNRSSDNRDNNTRDQTVGGFVTRDQKTFRNRDIVETLQSRNEIEDELSAQVEQLNTLCLVQLTLSMDGQCFSDIDRLNYSRVLKTYSSRVKDLVDQLFCE